MTIFAQLEPAPGLSNRRYAPRRSLRLGCAVNGNDLEAIVHDLSLTGLLLETHGELATGDTLMVEISEHSLTPARVIWNSGLFFGCKFDEPLSPAAVSAALLRAPSKDIPDVHEIVADDSKFSRRARMLVIFALALLSWAIVAAAITRLF